MEIKKRGVLKITVVSTSLNLPPKHRQSLLNPKVFIHLFLKYHTEKPDSVVFIKSFRLLLNSPPPVSGTFHGVAEVSLCHVERFVSASDTR